MEAIPVFFKRKLIGYYDGEILGYDFVILAAQVPLEVAADITANILIMANVLYDQDNQKAGLECYWIENLDHIPGFTREKPEPPKPKLKRERLPGKQLDLFTEE